MSEEYGSAWHRSLQQNPHGARHPEQPCVQCGAPTTRRAVTGVQIRVPHAGQNDYAPELAPFCDGCEAKRVQAQLERVANNAEVLPRLREEARQRLAQLKQDA